MQSNKTTASDKLWWEGGREGEGEIENVERTSEGKWDVQRESEA